jgi:hypothetical protein
MPTVTVASSPLSTEHQTETSSSPRGSRNRTAVDDVDEVVEGEPSRLARQPRSVLLHEHDGRVEPAQRGVGRAEPAVEPHGQREAESLRGVHEVSGRGEVRRERLVDQDRDPGPEQPLDQLGVCLGGRMDEGGVDSAVEQVVEVRRPPSDAVLPTQPVQSIGVARHQRQIDVVAGRQHREVGLLRDVTQAHHANPQRACPGGCCHRRALPRRLPTLGRPSDEIVSA